MFGFWFLLCVIAVVTTFGFGILLNMIFRRWWVSVLLFVGGSVYLFSQVGFLLSAPEWTLYAVSSAGAILAAWGLVTLRKLGYAMFTR